MRVECHPNFNVPADQACVSVRPTARGKRTYLMGTVYLSNVSFKVHQGGRAKSLATGVKNVHSWVVGDVFDEAVEQYEPIPLVMQHMVQVYYHFSIGRYMEVLDHNNGIVCYGEDVTDMRLKAAVCIGRRLYVSKEW